MINYNREVKKLLPQQLQDQIMNAMRKKPKQKDAEDEPRMIDLRPPVSQMTTGQLVMELQVNGLERLANSLLSYLMILEAKQRGYDLT